MRVATFKIYFARSECVRTFKIDFHTKIKL